MLMKLKWPNWPGSSGASDGRRQDGGVEGDESGAPSVGPRGLVRWIEKHWKGEGRCPVCAENDRWQPGDHVVELRRFRPGATTPGRPVQPLVSVTCMNCGHTLFFSAVVLGLVAEEE